MAVSRGHTPPVNLKERIAALQQRNVSPNTHQSAQAAPRGLPSVMGAGGLRDKIAKFEEKGGVPVPRGSFGMGAAPVQTENSPGRKRGELYGNRVTGLGLGLPGRPGGTSSASASRSGSPFPPRSDGSLSTSTSPSSSPLLGPRKRCISTGAALSSSVAPSPASFSTEMPVPPLPPNFALPGSAPRRNSVAVDFGSGRRVMSISDAKHGKLVSDPVDTSPLVAMPGKTVDSEGQTPPSPEPVDPAAEATPSQVEDEDLSQLVEPEAVDASPLVPEHQPPTETTEEPHPNPESAETPLPVQVEDPQPSSSETPNPLELLPPPVVDHPSPTETDSGNPNLDDPPLEDPPEATRNHPFPVCDASQDVSQSTVAEESMSKDGLSDYKSVPQSDDPPPPPSPPPSASSVLPSAPSDTPSSPDAPAETVVTDLSPSPPEEMIPVVASQDSVVIDPVPLPSPTDPVLPSISTPDLTAEARPQTQPTFKAVVHRKVTELPVSSNVTSSAIPQPTKRRLAVSNNVTEMSPNPGYGDLVVLLEEAALLEQRLTHGDGASSKSKSKELLSATTPTNAMFQPEPRYPPASTFTERAPMPSLDSGSLSVRSMSIPSIREPLIDGEIPEGDETDGRSLASTTFSQRSPSHRKYLSNIYRLTGRRSSAYMPGAYPRDSMSMSSEDSSPVATPSSDGGKRKGFGIAWPSASPKKGGPNVGRSSSFADKLFNRNRTKSNVSTTDQVLERTSLYQSSQPSLTLPFPSELPSSPEAHHRHHYHHQHQYQHYRPDTMVDSVQVPDARSRSSSWVSSPGGDSNAEFSPASSPLDKDIFDAFPSVPQTLPPGFRLDVVENSGGSVGRASTLPVNVRKQVDERLAFA